MSFSFVTAYPWWFLVLCPLAGLLAAGILYFRAIKKNPEQKSLISALFFFRFLAVTALVFLLFGPFIRKEKREVEKPVIVFAQDNSESLIIGKDSSFYKSTYKESVKDFLDQLREEYDVQTYTFGSSMKEAEDWNYSDKETDFSDLFGELETRFTNRNLGAVIIASDGIYNRGSSPLFSSSSINSPVFTIALGDTNARKDILISRVAANRIAYLGNLFPVQVSIDGRKCKGANTKVTISKSGTVLGSQNLTIPNDYYTVNFGFQLEAKDPGMQRYTVRVQQVEGELTVKNNVYDLFIEVLDSRQKILIVGAAPHPDLGALKQSIESAQTYQAEVSLLSDFKKSVKQYNLVILHQLPFASTESRLFVEQVKAAAIPSLVIYGSGVELNQLNAFVSGVAITDHKGRMNDVQAIFNKDFSLFQLSDQTRSRLEKLPPVNAPFANYRTAAGANVVAYQKIGLVETKDPLIMFSEINGVRQGFITGEGIWRWRLTDHALHGDHSAFNELIGKTIQFLSSKADKTLFRVNGSTTFTENEVVQFEAELYNESYEPYNDPEVQMTIINSEGKKFPFNFSKTSTGYNLNVGILPPDEYRYEATVKGATKPLSAKGKFIVTALVAEQINTIADHQLLYSLATKKSGEMYYPAELSTLLKQLKERQDITSVSYIQTTMQELIEEKWLFFLILIMLTVEWFLRKYNGLY